MKEHRQSLPHTLFERISADPLQQNFLENIHPPDWRNPRPNGVYDVIVIGGGFTGIMAARTAAESGARTALLEKDVLGGKGLHGGRIAMLALARTAQLASDMRNSAVLGMPIQPMPKIDFSKARERMLLVRERISRKYAPWLLGEMGIEIFFGSAEFRSPDSIAIAGETLRFRKAIITSGSTPHIPDVAGLREAGFMTGRDIPFLGHLPESLLIIGGTPLGCEMAQTFRRLGADVAIAQKEPMFLANNERDAAQILSDALARDGVQIHLNINHAEVNFKDGKKRVSLTNEGAVSVIEVENIFIATDPIPKSAGKLSLEKAGIAYDPMTGIEVDDFMQTSNPDIYAAGGVCGGPMFPDSRFSTAQIAAENALKGPHKKLSELIAPWCIFTRPEIAHVGLHVRDARLANIPVKTFTIPLHEVDRAIADSDEEGFVKIHVRDGSDEIIGATIVARHAGDLIDDIALAMNAKCGLGNLAEVGFPYPSQGDAIKMATNAWRRNQERKSC